MGRKEIFCLHLSLTSVHNTRNFLRNVSLLNYSYRLDCRTQSVCGGILGLQPSSSLIKDNLNFTTYTVHCTLHSTLYTVHRFYMANRKSVEGLELWYSHIGRANVQSFQQSERTAILVERWYSHIGRVTVLPYWQSDGTAILVQRRYRHIGTATVKPYWQSDCTAILVEQRYSHIGRATVQRYQLFIRKYFVNLININYSRTWAIN